MDLSYETIERQIVEGVPEISEAANRYREDEGMEGDDPGPLCFVSSTLGPYITVLVAMKEGPGRDRLLQRPLTFVDTLGRSEDSRIRDLLTELLVHPMAWWLSRCAEFIGEESRAYLNRNFPSEWRAAQTSRSHPHLEEYILDLYGTRDVILTLLQTDGVFVRDVPGISAPSPWKRLPSLQAAREDAEGVVFLSCYGTSRPYVIAPASTVSCAETVLLPLARTLANLEAEEPGAQEKAHVAYFRIAPGERVWQMNGDGRQHCRYERALWVADRFVSAGLHRAISRILVGECDRLSEDTELS